MTNGSLGMDQFYATKIKMQGWGGQLRWAKGRARRRRGDINNRGAMHSAWRVWQMHGTRAGEIALD